MKNKTNTITMPGGNAELLAETIDNASAREASEKERLKVRNRNQDIFSTTRPCSSRRQAFMYRSW
jgi:ADP-ribose pyrophosphatase YjhB (NUDIX family)